MSENNECEYCREENPRLLTGNDEEWDSEFSKIIGSDIYVEIWSGAYTPDPESHTMYIPIDYCPKCKRKL